MCRSTAAKASLACAVERQIRPWQTTPSAPHEFGDGTVACHAGGTRVIQLQPRRWRRMNRSVLLPAGRSVRLTHPAAGICFATSGQNLLPALPAYSPSAGRRWRAIIEQSRWNPARRSFISSPPDRYCRSVPVRAEYPLAITRSVASDPVMQLVGGMRYPHHLAGTGLQPCWKQRTARPAAGAIDQSASRNIAPLSSPGLNCSCWRATELPDARAHAGSSAERRSGKHGGDQQGKCNTAHAAGVFRIESSLFPRETAASHHSGGVGARSMFCFAAGVTQQTAAAPGTSRDRTANV